MLEPAGKIGHVIASPIQQQYNFLLLEKVSKMVCLLNSCEVADFWILSCAAGINVIVWFPVRLKCLVNEEMSSFRAVAAPVRRLALCEL